MHVDAELGTAATPLCLALGTPVKGLTKRGEAPEWMTVEVVLAVQAIARILFLNNALP